MNDSDVVAIVDARLGQALAGVKLMVELVTEITLNDDGTGSGTAQDGSSIDFEFCGGSFGSKSRPIDGSAAGIVVKLGGEGASAILIGIRDAQYEPAIGAGEKTVFNAFGVTITLTKDGVNINGSDYSGLKTEDLLSDMKDFITAVIADLASAAAAPASAYTASVNATALFAKMVTGGGTAYKSLKWKGG